MTDYDDECGAVDGMTGRENWSTWKKPVPVPLCPPQIPQDLIQAKPATDCSYGMALLHVLSSSVLVG
jgi:hypothetical protein